MNLSGSFFSLSKPVLLIYFLLLHTHLENEQCNKMEAQLLFVAFGGLQVFILSLFITGILKTFSLDTLGHLAKIFIIISGMCSNEGQVWNSSASWVVSVALSACGAPLMEHRFKEQRITCAPSANALLVCILCFRIFIYFVAEVARLRYICPAVELWSTTGCCPSAFLCTNYLLGTKGQNEELCQCNWLRNVASKRLFNRSFTTLKLSLDKEGKARRCVHCSYW